MKKIIVFALVLLADIASIAQQNDMDRICIRAVQPSYDNLPAESAQLLEDKLKRMITSNGYAGEALTDRFVLTAKINVISKDIVATTPSKVSQKLEVSLYVYDVIDKKIFSSTSINTLGIGINENKSLIQAFQRMPITNNEIKAMFDNAKKQIVDYYSSNCSFLMSEIDRLAQSQQYDEAIAKLVAVPSICEECYKKCQDRAVDIYLDKIECEGRKVLEKANGIWMTKQDYSSAEQVLELLSNINPGAKCQSDVEKLKAQMNKSLREHEARLQEKEEREYALKLKKYEDEQAFKLRKYEDDIEKSKATRQLVGSTIDAVKEVAISYFGGKTPTVNL